MPLIAFEGIDGTGKSSAIQAVAEALRKEGIATETTREETDGPTGEQVRRAVKAKWDPLATALLFAADRAAHVAELRPMLREGRLVLSDRYVHSSFAYQGLTLAGAVPDPDSFLRRLHEGWCPPPDAVVLLTCDPATAVARTRERGETTPYEKLDFLARVQARYLDLAAAEPGLFAVVDADRPREAVARDALQAVRRHLPPRGAGVQL